MECQNTYMYVDHMDRVPNKRGDIEYIICTQLQIREGGVGGVGIEDNSKIIFLISQ